MRLIDADALKYEAESYNNRIEPIPWSYGNVLQLIDSAPTVKEDNDGVD